MRKELLDNFIGQDEIKRKIEVFILPKIEKNSQLDHIMFDGMSGTGKTTLAKIIGLDRLKTIMGPSIKTKADVLALFTGVNEGDFIFIDEIHGIDKEIEELLYQIMDDRKMSISIGKAGDTNILDFEIPHFTLIGATTMSGMLSKPLKDRFGFWFKIDKYSEKDMEKIIVKNLENIKISAKNIEILSKNCKFTPRIAVNISKRLNDYCQFLNRKNLDDGDIYEFINLIGLHSGLNKTDMEYLQLLKENISGLGVNTISKNLQVEQINLIANIEPYLMSQGYIKITSKGRRITEKGLQLIASK